MLDKANTHPATRIEDLLVSLSNADEGGLKLDTLVAYALAGADLRAETLRDVMTEGTFSLDVAGALLDDRPPPFTRTLDSAIPGENIVLATYSDKRGQWAAVQREADGREFLAWAATEALARRVAALQAFGERLTDPVEDDLFVPIASLGDEIPPAPETLEPAPETPRTDDAMIDKVRRNAPPDAPEWRIKF